MAMAAEGWPGVPFAAATLFGIALAAGAANSLNCYLERDRDALMERTRNRPLPASRSRRARPSSSRSCSACSSTGSSTSSRVRGCGSRRREHPLLRLRLHDLAQTALRAERRDRRRRGRGSSADRRCRRQWPRGRRRAGCCLRSSSSGSRPHVWAIALFRKADYERAGIPMLPSVVGDQPTRWRMLSYTLALVPVTLAPAPLGLLGWIYLAVGARARRLVRLAGRPRAARAHRGGRAPHVPRLARLLVRALPGDAAGPGDPGLTSSPAPSRGASSALPCRGRGGRLGRRPLRA